MSMIFEYIPCLSIIKHVLHSVGEAYLGRSNMKGRAILSLVFTERVRLVENPRSLSLIMWVIRSSTMHLCVANFFVQ